MKKCTFFSYYPKVILCLAYVGRVPFVKERPERLETGTYKVPLVLIGKRLSKFTISTATYRNLKNWYRLASFAKKLCKTSLPIINVLAWKKKMISTPYPVHATKSVKESWRFYCFQMDFRPVCLKRIQIGQTWPNRLRASDGFRVLRELSFSDAIRSGASIHKLILQITGNG